MYSFLYLQQFSFSIWFCELDPLVFFFRLSLPEDLVLVVLLLKTFVFGSAFIFIIFGSLIHNDSPRLKTTN